MVNLTRHFTLPGSHAGFGYGGRTAREARMDFWRRVQTRAAR